MTHRPTARQILHEVFGYPEFRGRQEDVINTLAGGGSLTVLMPTGGGKSLCYQIPALMREGVAVVVSPLIALMNDQVASCMWPGLKRRQSTAAHRQMRRARLPTSLPKAV